MYTTKDIVTRGRIGSAQILFATDVEKKLANLEEETERLLGVSLSHEALLRLENFVAYKERGKFGYVTSSRTYDRDKEVYWAAVIAHYVQKEDFSPVIIPFDDLYRYHVEGASNHEKWSLVQKLISFGDISITDKMPYAIITGFTESQVFHEDAVWNIPNITNYFTTLNRDERNKIHLQLEKRELLVKEIEDKLKEDESLEEVIGHFSNRGLDQRTARFLVAYGLLRKQGDWQDAWGRHFSPGVVPLTFVLPQPAFLALTLSHPHMVHSDMNTRATGERYLFPPLEVVDGKLINGKETSETLDLDRTYGAREILRALSVLYP